LTDAMGVLDGFAGTVGGSFFAAPGWVDQSKKPGHTSQAATYGSWLPVLRAYVTTAYFFYSPNLVWFLVAATVYLLFPYDLEAAAQRKRSFFVERLLVNSLVVFAYFGFWNVSLYVWRWGKRKFNPSKNPTLPRQLHNIFYSSLGVLQWTVWEVCFMYAYATGRLGYISDGTALSNRYECLRTVGAILFVPLWRDFHFYFAHRFLHMRFLYKYVHSLHHRNTDIEPFSGLCMHPIEHLYYFSCVGPSLYLHASPFMMLWNGIHLLISPAASHSGWEDNFQSDQFHYLHHAQFECNYGTSGPPLDKMFGTFREKLGKSKEYQGEAKEKREEPTPANEFLSGSFSAKDILPPSWQIAVYNLLAYGTLAAFCAAAAGTVVVDASTLAAAVAVGPIVYGLLVLTVFGDGYAYLWPFHKERLIGSTGFHLIISLLMVVLPTYHFVTTVLKPPGEAVYFTMMDSVTSMTLPMTLPTTGLAALNVTHPDL